MMHALSLFIELFLSTNAPVSSIHSEVDMRVSTILFSISMYFSCVFAGTDNTREGNTKSVVSARAGKVETEPDKIREALTVFMQNEQTKQLDAAKNRRESFQHAHRWFNYRIDQGRRAMASTNINDKQVATLRHHKGKVKEQLLLKDAKDANIFMREKARNILRVGSIDRTLQENMKFDAMPLGYWRMAKEHEEAQQNQRTSEKSEAAGRSSVEKPERQSQKAVRTPKGKTAAAEAKSMLGMLSSDHLQALVDLTRGKVQGALAKAQGRSLPCPLMFSLTLLLAKQVSSKDSPGKAVSNRQTAAKVSPGSTLLRPMTNSQLNENLLDKQVAEIEGTGKGRSRRSRGGKRHTRNRKGKAAGKKGQVEHVEEGEQEQVGQASGLIPPPPPKQSGSSGSATMLPFTQSSGAEPLRNGKGEEEARQSSQKSSAQKSPSSSQRAGSVGSDSMPPLTDASSEGSPRRLQLINEWLARGS